jgi:phytoene dehydrogenase-like protein
VPSLNPYATPVRGLFLGSASAFPGGAVHGVPGQAAARAALRGARLPQVPELLRRSR